MRPHSAHYFPSPPQERQRHIQIRSRLALQTTLLPQRPLRMEKGPNFSEAFRHPGYRARINGLAYTPGGTAMQKVANRDTKVWHGATENGPRMMDESKTPPIHLGSCRYPTLCRGVLDFSIIQ
jgi:hypothetical protein